MIWSVFSYVVMAVFGITMVATLGWAVFYVAAGQPLVLPWRNSTSAPKKTADEMMKEAILKLRSVPGGREWVEEQARIAGFDIPAPPTPQQIRVDRQVVQMTGGIPVLFPTETGLLEINGTWYEKWATANGSYLKEGAAPRAQEEEEVHEESTAVRDISGKHIAYYRLNIGS